MFQWSLKKIKLTDLKEHPKNPRTMTKEQVAQLKISLERFGVAEKPVVNLDNMIIGGHQRLKTLKKMKIKEIDCLVPDRMLDEKEVDELNIRLNKNSGSWDWEMLGNEWEVNDLIDWGFNLEELHLDATEEDAPPKDEKAKKSKACPHCGGSLD